MKEEGLEDYLNVHILQRSFSQLREILNQTGLTHLQLVHGGPVLAGLVHVQLGLDLLGVIYQPLTDWSLGLQILVSLTDQGLLLDLTLNLEMKFSHLL